MKTKQIILRNPRACDVCGEIIPAGDHVVWLDGKATHDPRCQFQVEEVVQYQGDVDRYVIPYADLRTAFHKFLEDPTAVHGEQNRNQARRLSRNIRNEYWVGCTVEQMKDWIAHGYRVPGLDEIVSLIPGKPRRRLRYLEDGDELLLDLAWTGSDTPFVEWEKRIMQPELNVEIRMVFDSEFPVETIKEYQLWVARALQTLDENNVNMNVLIVMPTIQLTNERFSTCYETCVQVRQQGEAADFSNWSAMFSPGGFRMLGIVAIGTHAEIRGEELYVGPKHGSYGTPLAYGDFTVAWDEETQTILIGDTENAEAPFPEFEMTSKLQAILMQLDK